MESICLYAITFAHSCSFGCYHCFSIRSLEEFKKLNPPVDLVEGAEIEMTIRGDTLLYKNAVGGVGSWKSRLFCEALDFLLARSFFCESCALETTLPWQDSISSIKVTIKTKMSQCDKICSILQAVFKNEYCEHTTNN